MLYLENELIRVGIHPKGAELQSLFHKGFQLEYMWSGDPAIWGKHSPLLFPIVGTLKANTYYYKDKPYTLSRHGFARDMEFAVESRDAQSIALLLRNNAETFVKFPFAFELRLVYTLTDSGLRTTYRVNNPANEPLYFSVGGHPAFRVPLVADTEYHDYFLEFDEPENAPRWPISREGLIEIQSQPLLSNTRMLLLKKELFVRDALVLKHPASFRVALRSTRTERGLWLDYPDFPFLGIWAAPNADFVCIEPWCGIADSVDSDQQFERKEGIQRLEPGASFERTWSLDLF
jgi:galactose mutarotase-like enzyme